MPGITPVYGWPFQALGDPPDGPNLGEDLALAIEATLQAQVAALSNQYGLAQHQYVATSPNSTVSTSLANMAGGVTSLTLAKAKSSTRVRVAVAGSLIVNSGAGGFVIGVGVGSLGDQTFNVWQQTPGANERRAFAMERWFSGIAAGSVLCQPKWRVITSGTIQQDNNDNWTMTVEEIP